MSRLHGILLLVALQSLEAAPLKMDVPLYLFHSQLNKDFALLAGTPQLPQISNPTSYILFDEDPVAFGSEDPFVVDGDNSTLLNVYWSQSRRDIQTTTDTLAELNVRGGNYVLLTALAHVAGNSVPHYVAGTPLTPLTLVYSDSREDAVTSQFNGADMNAIFAAVPSSPPPFRATGHTLGYARQGNCTRCNVGLSESFPSAGGADCMNTCAPGTKSMTSIYHIGQGDMAVSTAGRTFAASMLAAGEVVRKLDPTVKPEFGAGLHMSFLYLCCYTVDERATIRGVLESTQWRPINITFDRAEWRIDNDGSPPTHYSVCIFLDEASQMKMLSWVAEVEAAIAAAGVSIHIPRAAQEPFHSTLAVVNGTTFPLEEAVAAINQLVPPGSWTGEGPLLATAPS
jgi:hypothetical protein